MHLKIITITACMCCTMYVGAQNGYINATKTFQQKYITELGPIISKDTAHIRFYPISEGYKIMAAVELLKNQPVFKMTTSSGKSKEAQKLALVNFSFGGKNFKLYAYQLLSLKSNTETANHFFIPFLYETSGKESYGGGRYLDFETGDINGNSLVIDFNKAYNPYCAFVKGYNCPVPPRENILKFAVKSGERYMKEKFKH